MPRPLKTSSQNAASDARNFMASFEAAVMPGAAEKDGHVSESDVSAEVYAQGFGSGNGMCSCFRCLRKSAPSTTDYKEAVIEVAMCLANPDITPTASDEDEYEDNPPIPQSPDKASQELAEAICQAAIEQADPVQLKQLLKAVSESQAAEICNTLAILAAQRGHANIIPVLAEEGADFNTCDRYRGGPPLMHAANNGHANTVKALLEAGADVDGLDHVGQTALMVAVFSDRALSAETLIKTGGASVHTEDNIGRTAMSHAAKYGSIDCLNLLGNMHADVFHKDHEGKTPLQIAEASSRSDAVTALKKWQQLQTMRTRCEKKKQKDATRRQEELTTEQLAEKQANADACAQALLADLAAEKEKEGLLQKAKAKKAKAKGKAKASALAAQAAESLPAAADVDRKDEAPSATAIQPPLDQENQVTAQSNCESLSRDTAQPSAAPQVSIQKSSNGVSTSQSSPLNPRDPDDSPSASSDNMKASRCQSPVPNVSQPQPQAAVDSPVPSPQVLRSPVPSSPASSLTHSPRPRSAASEADSVPEASPVHARSATSSPAPRAPSPSLHPRASLSPATQQAFSQQLRSALSPAGSLQAQSPHHDPSPQKQAAYTPPATPRGHPAEQPSGAVRSPADSPARQDLPAEPSSTHLSPAAQLASPSRPSSAASSSQPASVMADMTNAMPRSSPASPGLPRPAVASPRPAEPAAHALAASNSHTQAVDSRAAAAAALTGPPKANAAGAHVPSPRPAGIAPSQHAFAPPARSVSPFEPNAAALPPLAAALPAGKGKPPSSSDSRPAPTEAYLPDGAQGEATAPPLPPASAPVRKPPGLPSPVPVREGQGSADLEDVIASDRWPDQVSAKSETSSNPRSPKKEIKVPAVLPPAPPPTAPPPAPTPPASDITSEVASEDGSGEDKQSVASNPQPLDQSEDAIAARLAKEREQQAKQEAKHLLAKERAAARRRQEIAEQDRRQQEEHARRAQAKAKAALGETAPGLHPPVAGPYPGPPVGFREPFRGVKDFDEAAPRQAPKAFPAAGVRHIPAHPAPHGGRPPAHLEADYNSDTGSDFGGPELGAAYGRGQGRGRTPIMERGGRARGRGRGLMPDGHPGPGRAHPLRAQGANPLAFVPLLAPPPEPAGARGNPDPFAFGAARPSTAQLEEQLTLFSDQIYAARDDVEQEFVHIHVLDELKKMVGQCKVQKIQPPPGAKEAIGDLEKTVQARHQLDKALIPPLDGALLEAAIHTGRSCKLLCKQIMQRAEAALREFHRMQRPPPDNRKHAEPRGIRPDPRVRGDPRGHPEAPRGRPIRGNPDARGHADLHGPPDGRGPPLRGHPEPRGPADARGARADNRARADSRPRAEPPQQRFVPQQPQGEQPRRHPIVADPPNGRHMAPEFAEAPNNKHPPRNPANPPRKGRNQGGPAAAANAAPHQAPVVNNAAQPPASPAPVAKAAVVQESDDCVVCWAHIKDVVCVPCGHVAMCKSCSKAVLQQSGLCPVCRVTLTQIIPFFKT